MAKLFNHNELEAIKDRKDKFKRWVSEDKIIYNLMLHRCIEKRDLNENMDLSVHKKLNNLLISFFLLRYNSTCKLIMAIKHWWI